MPMAIDSVIHTNQHSIERVLNAGLPVLLYFWKRGAAPSEQMDAVLDRLAGAYAGRALIAKVDAGTETELVRRHRVQQLPTLVFAKNGQVVATATGAAPRESLQAWLDYLIRGGSQPALPGGPSVSLDGAPRPTGPDPARANGTPAPGSRESGSSRPVVLTDANFQQVIGGAQPVLVDFWAPWCGPCRMVAPAVEQVAKEFQGRAVVAKMNVDENPRTAQQFRVMSIPTLMVFKNGQAVEQMVGVQPAAALSQRLAKHV
jgi:thioredoxin 1